MFEIKFGNMKYLLNLFRCYKLFEFTHKIVYNCERCGFDFKTHCDVYIDETIICKTCAENLKGNFINGGITK